MLCCMHQWTSLILKILDTHTPHLVGVLDRKLLDSKVEVLVVVLRYNGVDLLSNGSPLVG